jgi:hypothetical protein
MNQALKFQKPASGPILATLMPGAMPEPEVVNLKHGVYKIAVDDAGRWLLFERRSIVGGTLHDFNWNKVLTVERSRGNAWLYEITFAPSNERVTRTGRFARQIIQDYLDHEEMQFMELLHGV